MISSRIALFASVACAALWAAKALVMAAAGPGSPAEDLLFYAGLLALLVGGGAVGVALAGRRGVGIRVASGIAGVVAAYALVTIAGWLVGLVTPAHAGWVWGEANLWLSALVALGVTLARRRPERAPVAGARLSVDS
jgi:hypothetical protein